MYYEFSLRAIDFMKKVQANKIIRYFAYSMVAGGVLLLLPFITIWFRNRAAVTNVSPLLTAPMIASPVEDAVFAGKPVRLVIPSLGIDIAVEDGAYNPENGAWTLSNDKAHFALPSVESNTSGGNTLIYGHNRKGVFALLKNLKTGDQAIVITDNGIMFTYKFRSAEDVAPYDTAIFGYEGPPQLTLQTCSGIWMQDRRLHYFDLVSVETKS